MARPMRTSKMGLIRMAGCWWTVMTWRSCGRRYLFTEAGTVSVFGTSLIPAPGLNRREELCNPACRRGQEGPDVMNHMRSARRGFDHPPDDQGEREPSGDGFCIQRRLPGRPDCLPARGAMSTCTNLPPTAYAVKPSCRHEYAPCTSQYARSAKAVRHRMYQSRRHRVLNRLSAALIGDFAFGRVSHLTAFPRAGHGEARPALTWADRPR